MQKIAVAVASQLRWVPGWHSPAVGWRRRRGRGGRRPAAGQGRPGGGRGRRAGPDTWAMGGIPGKKSKPRQIDTVKCHKKDVKFCSEGHLSTCCIWPCSPKETCLRKKKYVTGVPEKRQIWFDRLFLDVLLQQWATF